MKIKRMTDEQVEAIVYQVIRAWTPGLVDQALERRERGVDAVDGHNLRRAELAERRLKEAEQREAVAMDAARTHATNIAMLRNSVTVLEDQKDRLEKQLTELRRLNVNQRRTIIETADARDRYMTQAQIAERRANDLVGEIRALIEDFTDRMDRNQREVAMTSNGYARGRRDAFSYTVRELRGLIE